MPKLKISPVRKQADIVMGNIRAKGVWIGCKTDRDFATKLCMSTSTFRNRRLKPMTFTLEELLLAAQVLGCNVTDLFTAPEVVKS